MKVLHRYIAFEITRVAALSSALFLFVILMDRASTIAETVLGKGVSFLDFLSVLAKGLPAFLGIVIPMSFVLSVVIVFIGMNSNNELTAAKSCGISLKELSKPVSLLGLIFSLLSFYSLMFLAPKSNVAMKRELEELLRKKITLSITEKRFSSNFPGVTFYVEKLYPEKGLLVNFMASLQKKEKLVTAFGRRGFLRTKGDTVFLDIEDGSAQVVDWKKPKEFKFIKFKSYTVELYKFTRKERFKAAKYKTLFQLLKERDKEARVAVVKRTALAFASLIVGIIGFSIAVSIPRGSIGVGVLISLLLIVLYYILYTFSKKVALKTGQPLLALLPDVVFGAAALLLYKLAVSERIRINVGARW
ncbi:LptF/LptG family permease [Thermovibrio ammonificans]